MQLMRVPALGKCNYLKLQLSSSARCVATAHSLPVVVANCIYHVYTLVHMFYTNVYRSDEECQQALAHACRLACLPREGLERALTEKTIEIGARRVTSNSYYSMQYSVYDTICVIQSACSVRCYPV
jgi:hypothetical protein